jgi:hypothetical protein
MKRMLLVVMFLSLLVFSGNSMAQIVEKSSDVSGYVGILKSLDTDLKIESGGQELTGTAKGESEFTFGARYNYNFDLHNALEGTFGVSLPEHAKVLLYYVNYKYNIALSNDKLVPFVTGGVGAVTISPDEGSSDTNLTFNFGGGLGYFVKENLGVRVDVRDIFIKRGESTGTAEGGATATVKGFTQQNIEISAGVTYFFI